MMHTMPVTQAPPWWGQSPVMGQQPVDPGTQPGQAQVGPNAPGGSSSSWLTDLQNLTNLGGSIYGLYNASQLQGAAGKAFGESNPFGPYRPGYGAQLLDLMQHPESVSQLPGYQFLLGQGVQAIDRSAAAPGGVGLGSGGEMAELMKYGQGLADSFYQQQIQTLSGLAGANIPPANPYQGLMGMDMAGTGVGRSISGISGALPGTLNLINKLFPGGAGAPASGTTDPGWSAFGGGAPLYDPNTGGYPGQTPTDLSNTDWLAGTGLEGTPGGMNDPGGGMDLSGMFSGPRPAGGGAATPGQPSGFGRAVGIGSGALDIYGGVQRGGVLGAAQAGLGATRLGSSAGAFGGNTGTVNQYAGGISNALGIYSGLKSGGVAGYEQAGVNFAQLGARTGAFGAASGQIGQYAGYAAIPLSVYEFAKNWESGATGSDALQGAEAGASIGSIFGPIGTGVGLVIGGAVGAISSLFGPGRSDPESATFGAYSTAYKQGGPGAVAGATAPQTFRSLAGLFDLRQGQISGNIPIYNQYGRMGENQFVTDMAHQVNSAIKAGKLPSGATPDQMYSSVVAPWISSFGKGGWTDMNSSAIQHMLVQLLGDWQSGNLTSRTPVGIDGQTLSGLPTFGH